MTKSPDIAIRSAQREDIRTICDLVGLMSPMGHKHDYRDAERKFQECIATSPDYFLFVAIHSDSDCVVGTGMMHLQHKLSYKCGTAAHLEDVVVHPDYRGQGIGEAIIKTAIRLANLADCYKIMLTCYPKTVPYYERFGFCKHDVGIRLQLKEEIYDVV